MRGKQSRNQQLQQSLAERTTELYFIDRQLLTIHSFVLAHQENLMEACKLAQLQKNASSADFLARKLSESRLHEFANCTDTQKLLGLPKSGEPEPILLAANREKWNQIISKIPEDRLAYI